MREKEPKALPSYPFEPIQISSLKEGILTVEATIIGCLAVHEAQTTGGAWPGLYSITHLPTGLSLGQLTEEYTDRAKAVECCEWLVRNCNSLVTLGTWPIEDRREWAKLLRSKLEARGLIGTARLPGTSLRDNIPHLNGYSPEGLN